MQTHSLYPTCHSVRYSGKKQLHIFGLIKSQCWNGTTIGWCVVSSWETRVPAVMMLKDMQKRKHKPRFSKANLYVRDVYTCQYCNTPYTKANLTLDHVLPLSKGGKTSWTNIVAACRPCNGRKADKTHMKPIRAPYAPDYYDLVNRRKQLDMSIAHPSWKAYL